MGVLFPVSVRFEDGEVELYESVRDLVPGLEDFGADLDAGCEVGDAGGPSASNWDCWN